MAEGGNQDSNPVPSDSDTPAQFLETPEGRKLAYIKVPGSSPGVIFIHGLCSNMHGQKAKALEELCQRKGNAYVRFELSGHGQSSEDFKSCNLTTWLEDVNSVISMLTEGPQVIVGSSLGGWLMFLYTMRNPDNVCGLVGVSSAPDFTQMLWKDLDKDAKAEVKKNGMYKLPSPYSDEPYELTLQLIQDGERYSILDMPGIEYIKSPTWLFHGEKDTVVSPSTSLKLMQKLQCPVSLKTVEDGDHRLSRPDDIKMIQDAVIHLITPREELNDDTSEVSELED